MDNYSSNSRQFEQILKITGDYITISFELYVVCTQYIGV